METVQIPSQLDGISPLKDGGMSLRFHTQEMSKPEMATLMGYYQQFGYLLFKPDEFKQSEIPTKDSDGNKRKSEAQRAKNALWVLGKEKGLTVDAEQEIFYQRRMDRFIESVKEEIGRQRQINEQKN